MLKINQILINTELILFKQKKYEFSIKRVIRENKKKVTR